MTPASLQYRARINASGSPSAIASAGYSWRPGTELGAEASASATLH